MGKTLKRVRILTSERFEDQLKELKNVPFEVKSLRGFPSLEQTKRNRVSRDLLEGLYNFLFEKFDKEDLATVHYTTDGIALEIANESIFNGFPDGNGTITLMVNLTLPNLEYDPLENLREEDHDYGEIEAEGTV